MKKKKDFMLIATALLVFVIAVYIPSSYAVNLIDLNQKCTLTIETAGAGDFAEDLNQCEIPTQIYQIAACSSEGTYTAKAPFDSLNLTDAVVKEGKWNDILPDALSCAKENEAVEEVVITNGIATVANLEAGIYLIIPQETDSKEYQYSFQPFFVDLPDNLAYHVEGGQDKWNYEVNASLKAEQKPKEGNLKIVKTLTNYCDLLKNTTFVFEVEAVNEMGANVYSNVVSMNFSEAGTKEMVIEGLPAGATVTVTEAYSGGSYTLTSESQKSVTISAEEMQEVTFENTYDDKLINSYGVTNHFDYDEDEGWQWSRMDGEGAAQ